MQIDKRVADEKVGVLALEGRLNLVSAPSLRTAVEETVAETPHVVVDLSAVTFMDSSGLGALIAGLKRARQAQGDLRIAGANEQVLTVLRLTNLDKVLKPQESVEAACRGW
jgi:anti-sigma B factor antagonist